nr:retrotransposon protein, putative, Ty1-copia subclass [Tanacetum cinerariifolium]
MTRKPFPYRTERETDLLGIIHTDVCSPLRHVSRQGATSLPLRMIIVWEGQKPEEIQDKDTSPSENTSKIPIEVEGFKPPQEEVIPIYPESDKWLDAINAEMQSMKDNQVWCLVELPPNSTFYDYEIWKMDVKIDFLNGYLDEDIYMVQPEGFIDPKQPIKALLLLNIPEKYASFRDPWEASFILGIKIYRARSKRLIGLSQSAYMEKILKRLKMDTFKHGYIPMQEKLDLNKTQGASTPKEVKHMKNVPYASAVGSIMYAVRCTRPDVAFA